MRAIRGTYLDAHPRRAVRGMCACCLHELTASRVHQLLSHDSLDSCTAALLNVLIPTAYAVVNVAEDSEIP